MDDFVEQSPPSLNELDEYSDWELHEAILTITDSWPYEATLYEGYCSSSGEWFCFYGLQKQSHPRQLGRQYDFLLRDLMKAITAGEFPVRRKIIPELYRCYDSELFYIVSKLEVIKFALIKGYKVNPDLLAKIGIQQIIRKNKEHHQASLDKVSINVTAQWISLNQSCQKFDDIFKDPLFELICPKVQESKARKAMKGCLTSSKGAREKKPSKAKTSVKIMLLEEVVKKDSQGNPLYRFPHLLTALTTALLLEMVARKDLLHDEERFLSHFYKTPLVGLYLANAPDFIVQWMKDILSKFYYSCLLWKDICDSCRKLIPSQPKDKRLKDIEVAMRDTAPFCSNLAKSL